MYVSLKCCADGYSCFCFSVADLSLFEYDQRTCNCCFSWSPHFFVGIFLFRVSLKGYARNT